MTVCIAAIADSGNAIITATDQMLGAGVMTADLPMATKGRRFYDRWTASFAGNDISLIPPILSRVEDLIDSSNITEVARVFATAYRQERTRIAEESILFPLGLDMQSFTAMLATDTSAEVGDLKRRIQQLEFDPTFLVSGFDENDLPHIFVVEPPGVVRHYTHIGHWSIGSGAEAALSSLFFRQYSADADFANALYYVAEAKFMAESSVYVGKHTIIVISTADATYKMFVHGEIDPLREIWMQEGRPRIPNDLTTRLAALVDSDTFKQMETAKYRETLIKRRTSTTSQQSDSQTSTGRQ